MRAFAELPQVKLIVLDKVETLRRQHGLQDSLTMEVLRILASPDLDVRKKALGIALELVRTARSPVFPRGTS
jgi:vesicle coat complex subunit